MYIQIEGAAEHNLKGIDIDFGDGLTVVTGVSGSGKTSLVFDTLYHEARRRFLDIYATGDSRLRLSPAKVASISGLGPAVAVGQNLLNRNPASTLGTASGLHPFLRLLFARFGERHCSRCGAGLSLFTEDEVVERIIAWAEQSETTVLAPLARGVRGSHRTLLAMLVDEFGCDALLVDGLPWHGQPLDPSAQHDIDVRTACFAGEIPATRAREAAQRAWALGANAVLLCRAKQRQTLSRAPVCVACGTWFSSLEPVHFRTACPFCKGRGCERCDGTGLHPEAAAVRWSGLRLPDLLSLTVDAARALFLETDLPPTAGRLEGEITRRLEALARVGLGYISLDRSSPTLSRGESQRVRLAVVLTSRLEDVLHVLDEPTIGQHPADVARLLPAFRDLLGPVAYVEHDRAAAAAADRAIDLGPGAGSEGGRVVFSGSPAELWRADTPTGRYFSLRESVRVPQTRPQPDRFLTVRGASLRNLDEIDVPIPLGRLTVVTGVSGSGKSTFVQDVLCASLARQAPVGCRAVEGPIVRPVMVDQSPIGRNPRSNPATYTKLSDVIRDCFARATGLTASHFSFNRAEGACPACKGIGAVEVRMRYLPSTWIPCADCGGLRFSDKVLAAKAAFGQQLLSIADFYDLSVAGAVPLLSRDERLSDTGRRTATRILQALLDIGLGYLRLGQPSPTLSGGEAQRVKLAKYLGRRSLLGSMLILDEPSTGLHAQDIAGLLVVLDRLVRRGATIVIVEHNTDVIRAADWVIDLGPGAGPSGGRVLYAGPVAGLLEAEDSITGRALREEAEIHPRSAAHDRAPTSRTISIRNARANNLRGVDIDLVKGALTVVTGVSGSGKSSLVSDVLQAEARRRFLESLSLYERQSTREGSEAPVDSVSGLGVAVTITPERQAHARRATVGTVTEISHHLATLLACVGERTCLACGARMRRGRETWVCPSCQASDPIAEPRHFAPTNYAAACLTCHGVGSLRKPNPSKLIAHPEKPLCGGAMYSPGFFPKGYLCKPYNGGYYEVQALASQYGFDPATTPWDEMSPEAQNAFLFGDPEPMRFVYHSRTGRTRSRTGVFHGFYRWIGDWDVGGTYTDTQVCPDCHGGRLRPEYAAVTLDGNNLHRLSEMPLGQLRQVLESLGRHLGFASGSDSDRCRPTAGQPGPVGMELLEAIEPSLRTALSRLRFLLRVGLGYLHLSQGASTLSAGEAQRIRLGGLLGSGLTSLTVLLDEPSRGLHPCEVDALAGALAELRDDGNTVIVVEHDLQLIRAADRLIDMGPGAGAEGGKVVAEGPPEEVARANTATARWLRGEGRPIRRERREPQGWMTVRGARANNLRGLDVQFPLGTVIGVCGVSGSGKSTLLFDTLGRALAPKKQTTSVALEQVDPGEHDGIDGAPRRAILVDQSKRGVRSPASFLGLNKPICALYARSEDAVALGLDEGQLARRCTVCGGSGSTGTDMGFLPRVHTPCEACSGTGYRPEAWEVHLHGVALPEVFGLTIREALELFGEVDGLARTLAAACEVGLEYLVLRQPGHALSGGEAQRLKIVKELRRSGSRRGASEEALYILDEPTVGQHMEDVVRLMGVLHQLVDAKGRASDARNTVIVVEHHPYLLAQCDWLVELGPGGGPDGGTVVAEGTPEVLATGNTPTAPYLRAVLGSAI